MGVEFTDQLLFKLCRDQIDLAPIMEEIAGLSAEAPVLISGAGFFMHIFPAQCRDLVQRDNVFTTHPLPGYESNHLPPESVSTPVHMRFLGFVPGGINGSVFQRERESVPPDMLLSFDQPVQKAFARLIITRAPELLAPHQKINRAKKLSLIVLSGLNNAGSLSQMLTSLRDHTEPDPDIEVIVCVNGSTDETAGLPAGIIGDRFAFKVVKSPGNVGIAGGFNLGIDIAEGQYCCLLQDDILFTRKQWHREMMHYLDAHDDIGALGGFMGIWHFKKPSFEEFEIPWKAVRTNLTGRCEWAPMREWLIEADAALCMNVIFRNGLARMDDSFNPNGLEDIAFSYDIRAAGYKVFITDAGISHGLTSATRTGKTGKEFTSPVGLSEREHKMAKSYSRVFHYHNFMQKYAGVMRPWPKGFTEADLNLDYVLTFAEKRTRDWNDAD